MTVRERIWAGLACTMAIGVIGSAALSDADRRAQDTLGPRTDPTSFDMDKMMERMATYGAPGAHHEMLQYFVGDWDIKTSMWMGGEGAGERMEGEASASIESILGGRFVHETFRMDWMGEPFEGHGIKGYDNFNQRYVSTWIDNSSTGVSTSDGFAEMDGKSLVFYGAMDDAGMDVRQKPVKYVYRMVDQNTFEFEIHDLHIGQTGSKVMHMVYTRRSPRG